MRDHIGLANEAAGADSAYGTSLICKTLDDMRTQLHAPGMTGGVGVIYKVEFTRNDFAFDKTAHGFIWSAGKKFTL